MVSIDGDMVEFRFYHPGANQVHLAGDFNHWRKDELPMVRSDGGYWVARMRLPSGEFKFRYCADGEWFTDYAAFGVEPGRFGLDSVVRIPQVTLRIAPAEAPQIAAAA
jgi:1,4-alpha-glucan branching enzyme